MVNRLARCRLEIEGGWAAAALRVQQLPPAWGKPIRAKENSAASERIGRFGWMMTALTGTVMESAGTVMAAMQDCYAEKQTQEGRCVAKHRGAGAKKKMCTCQMSAAGKSLKCNPLHAERRISCAPSLASSLGCL